MDPVIDAHDNRIFWYFPEGSKISIPITVSAEKNGPQIYSTTFDRHQNPGFQVDRDLPQGAWFRVEWPLGPWGDTQVVEGVLDDPKLQYQFDTVTTTHFTIHSPRGHQKRTAELSRRLEEVFSIYADWIGREPPLTEAKHFYIEPAGLWASDKGQELFQHGFISWHPRDPASLQWEGCMLHEIGHRIQLEHFRVGDQVLHPTGESTEAISDLLRSLAIDKLHGERAGQFIRRWNTQQFFDNLQHPDTMKRERVNVRFVIESYLPKRFGSDITRGFLRGWAQSWLILKEAGYIEDEAVAAFYSTLAGENLWWLFELCGYQGSEEHVMAAMAKLTHSQRVKKSE